MTERRHTADSITDDALDALYERAAIYQAAWHSARRRARVLSDELTRRAPLTGQYAAAIDRVQQAAHDLPYEHARQILAALDEPKEGSTP